MSPAVFAHGHLRLYLLSLLDERPKHGYELIQELGDRFGGTYVPSAGTIYPRLSKLEEDGMVTKTSEGRKTVYAITDAGRAELREREGELDGIESELTDSVRRLADEVRTNVQDAMKSLRAELAAATQEMRDDARSATRAARTATRDATRDARDATADARGASRELLGRADAALAEFRADLRAELREQAGLGRLDRETVAVLEERLGAVRREIVARLR